MLLMRISPEIRELSGSYVTAFVKQTCSTLYPQMEYGGKLSLEISLSLLYGNDIITTYFLIFIQLCYMWDNIVK